MANSFDPTVLPQYYYGDFGQGIQQALQGYADRMQKAREFAGINGPGTLPKPGLFGFDPYSDMRDSPWGGGVGNGQTATTAPGAPGGSASATAPVGATSPDTASAALPHVAAALAARSADPFYGNRVQAGAGAEGFIPSGDMGRGNVTTGMMSGTGTGTMPSIPALHGGRPGEFNGINGFNGHAPVTEGWEDHVPAPAPTTNPLSTGAPATAQGPTASTQMTATAAPNQNPLLGVSGTGAAPRTTFELNASMEPAKLALEQRKEQAGEVENGLQAAANGALSYDPNRDPNITRALAVQTPELAIKNRLADIESRKSDIELQLGTERNALTAGMLQKEYAELQLQGSRLNAMLGEHQATSFGNSTRPDQQWFGMYNTQWKPALSAAQQGNPVALKSALMAFAMGSDTQSGQIRASVLRMMGVDDTPDMSIPGKFSAMLDKKFKSGLPAGTLNQMGQYMDSLAAARAQHIGSMYHDLASKNPGMSAFSTSPSVIAPGLLDDSGNFIGKSGTGGSTGLRSVTADEYKQLQTAHPGVDLSKYYTVQGSQP